MDEAIVEPLLYELRFFFRQTNAGKSRTKSHACRIVVAVIPRKVAKTLEKTLQSSFPASSNSRKAADGSTGGTSPKRLCILPVPPHLIRRHGVGGSLGQFISQLRRKGIELLD